MSAICGEFNLDGRPAETDMLASVMDALSFYGADGSAVCRDGPVVLGHQMRHVTPESLSERLPWRDPATQLTITADARIDNRDELCAALGLRKATISDSELILRAYQKWGRDCPAHLIGDFAFAIWDVREQCLFCARDHIGVRPFYYHAGTRRFVFASDIRGILACPATPADLDEAYIAAYLRFRNFTHLQRTFYRGVRKLPPAHWLTVSRRGVDGPHRYWDPRNAPQVRLGSDDEYAERLSGLLAQAVNERTRCVGQVGAHLSGGLDSSAVAVLAARRLPADNKTLHAYTWSPPPDRIDEAATDERPLVRAISSREQMRLHYARVEPQDFMEMSLRDVSREPVSTLGRETVIAREAAGNGVRVMLSGWGGDESASFDGRGYLADLLLRGRWPKLAREIGLLHRVNGVTRRAIVRKRLVLPLVPNRIYQRMWDVPNDLPSCLRPEFAAHIERVVPIERRLLRFRPGARRFQRMLLEHGHLTLRLEHWASEGAAHGIQYGFPLLDRRVLDFCLSVPAEQFFKNGWRRYLFRKAVEGILPAEAQWNRSKLDPAMYADNDAVANETSALRRAWLAERENDPNWGRCVDFRTVRQALAKSNTGGLDGLGKALAIEITYHNNALGNTSQRPSLTQIAKGKVKVA